MASSTVFFRWHEKQIHAFFLIFKLFWFPKPIPNLFLRYFYISCFPKGLDSTFCNTATAPHWPTCRLKTKTSPDPSYTIVPAWWACKASHVRADRISSGMVAAQLKNTTIREPSTPSWNRRPPRMRCDPQPSQAASRTPEKQTTDRAPLFIIASQVFH